MKYEKIINLIRCGGAGVLPTDTLYGLVGSVMRKKTVARIYRLKKRTPKKPCIILIGGINDLKRFSIKISQEEKKTLGGLWPGKVSVILPCSEKKFFYLHRGTRSLAFRLPRKNKLIKIIKKTGPLLAPSANPEGLTPAQNLAEARKYFGSQVDFYVSGGKLDAKPSTLVSLRDGKLKILRKGAVQIKNSV